MNAWRMRRPSVGADRNVLQIRIRATTAGPWPPPLGDKRCGCVRCAALICSRQLVGVGRLELRHAAIFQNQLRQRDRSRRSSSSTSSAVEGWPVGVLRITGMPSLPNRISCSCFGESTLKTPPASWCACALQLQHARRQLRALRLAAARDPPARPRAPCGTAPAPAAARCSRRRTRASARASMLRPEGLMQLQRDVGILGRIFRGALHVDLIEGDLLRALAGDVLEVNGLDAEISHGARVHVVARRDAVEHIGFEHGVEALAVERDAVVGEHVRIEFQMMAELGLASCPRAPASMPPAPCRDRADAARPHSRGRAAHRPPRPARPRRTRRRSAPACSPGCRSRYRTK